jgi:hypothetical protein
MQHVQHQVVMGPGQQQMFPNMMMGQQQMPMGSSR